MIKFAIRIGIYVKHISLKKKEVILSVRVIGRFHINPPQKEPSGKELCMEFDAMRQWCASVCFW